MIGNCASKSAFANTQPPATISAARSDTHALATIQHNARQHRGAEKNDAEHRHKWHADDDAISPSCPMIRSGEGATEAFLGSNWR